MAVNKVVLGDETLLDLTSDTATAADVAEGKTFHLASGAAAVGTASGGGSGVGVFYGTCATAAATTAKVVVCEEFTSADLVAGTVLIVRTSVSNTVDNPSLNVNSTGAISTRIGNSASWLRWPSQSSLLFVYDGQYWVFIAGTGTMSAPLRGGAVWYSDMLGAANVRAKTSTIENFTFDFNSLVVLRPIYANTYKGSLTINVNAKGAKSVYTDGKATSSTNPLYWQAGDYLLFIYRNQCFYYIGGSSEDSSYTLPAATASTLGGIKVGDGLSITSDGTLSAAGGGGGSSWTSLTFDQIFADSVVVSTDGVFLTNGQLVYVSMEDATVDDLLFGDSAYAPARAAIGAAFCNGESPGLAAFDSTPSARFISVSGDPVVTATFTIIYPIA